MELSLRPYNKNTYPLRGVLVRQAAVAAWIRAVQQMGLFVSEVELFPIPGATPGSIWGCMIIVPGNMGQYKVEQYELCQAVTPHFFIAERSVLYPVLSAEEIGQLFPGHKYIYHPDFGLVELEAPLDVGALIMPPAMKSYHMTVPAAATFIPQQVRSAQVIQVSQEETLKEMEEKLFPKTEQLEEKPLNLAEQLKLKIYQSLFTRQKGSNGKEKPAIGKTPQLNFFEKLLSKIMPASLWVDKMQEDYEDLEQRNANAVDRLLEMLMKNPEEALKYAIPFDESGAARGPQNQAFNLSKRWQDLNWSSRQYTTSSSGSVSLGNRAQELQQQYMATAEELIRKGKYHDAAFVYMKLLKNYRKAAEILEEGKYYKDAASIYLRYAGDKHKAALCYEKGMLITEAIDIYKELKSYEKAADLYMSISKKKEAYEYYQKTIDDQVYVGQYLKASVIYRDKMGDLAAAQDILLKGWDTGRDSANCLKTYFANIADDKVLADDVRRIYDEVPSVKGEVFLDVIKGLYKKPAMAEMVKNIAYEIVAANIIAKPAIAGELKIFNADDIQFTKDTVRYRSSAKRR